MTLSRVRVYISIIRLYRSTRKRSDKTLIEWNTEMAGNRLKTRRFAQDLISPTHCIQ